MKKFVTQIWKITLGAVMIFAATPLWAQAPQQLNYQGALRDNKGDAIPNKEITLQLGILDGSPNGNAQYQEIRKVTTNKLGLYSVAIGSPGAIQSTDNFSQINWGNGAKFLKVEIDTEAGNNFVLAGVSPLLSVPYALYAKYAENGPQGPAGPEGPAGAAGLSVTNVIIDSQGHLILTLSDNSTVDAGLATGPAGSVGPAGPQGPAGPAGAGGLSISTAVVDSQGHLILTLSDNSTIDAGIAVGPPGPAGQAGVQGPVGPAGANGTNGLSVINAALDSQGHLILTLSDNSTLDAGIATGPAGPIGPQGPIGATGPEGPQGIQGETGPAGPVGPQGPAGPIGATGPAGAQGPAGPTGPNGLAMLSQNTAEPVGTNCVNGGVRIDSGLDLNANGLLDQNEITTTSFVCNGTMGADGAPGPQGPEGPQGPAGVQGPIGPNGLATLSLSSPEPVGSNCTTGGLKIETGLDLNANGILDQNEITSTSFVCNGAQGPQGPQGIAGPTGMPVLTDSHIYVGDVNNFPIDVSMTGDATISNTGILTIADKAITENKIADGAVTLVKMAGGPADQVYMTNSAGAPILSSFNTMGWSLMGNSGTSDGFHFVGTTDDVPLNFRVNSLNAGRIDHTTGATTLGYLAGNSSTTILHNTLIGNQAGELLTSGSNRNTFIGAFAGRNVALNSGLNTAIGESSLSSLNAAGSFNNVALGSLAGMQFTGGNNNVFIGKNAGLSASGTSNANTLIGLSATASPNLSNATAIGANAVVTVSNSMVLGGTGANEVNVGINTDAPEEKLHINRGNLKIHEGVFMSSQTSAMVISTPIPSGIVGANPGAVPMTNVKGQVVVDGTNNASTYTMVLISFSAPTPYTSIPSVMITPANETAADADYYVNSSVNGFSIFYKNKSMGLRDAAFNYWVIQ